MVFIFVIFGLAVDPSHLNKYKKDGVCGFHDKIFEFKSWGQQRIVYPAFILLAVPSSMKNLSALFVSFLSCNFTEISELRDNRGSS